MKPTTPQEAFALHSQSCFYDAINGHIGLLNCMLADGDFKNVQSKVHGDMEDFFRSQIETLRKCRNRLHNDVIEYVGGEDRYKELQGSFWINMISHYQTWKQGRPSDTDGNSITERSE